MIYDKNANLQDILNGKHCLDILFLNLISFVHYSSTEDFFILKICRKMKCPLVQDGKDKLISERKVMLMRKSMKKKVAMVLALTVLASGVNYSVAGAAPETVNWKARYINVPVSIPIEDIIGYATLQGTSERYTGTVTKMSDFVNRKLTLSCTTHRMSTGSLEYNNTGSISWTISGSIGKVTYRMEAYTTETGVLEVEGDITR